MLDDLYTIVKNRVLMTEFEIDKQYTGKFILLDLKDVPPTHDGGYIVAYGDNTDEVWNALFDLGQEKYNSNCMIQVGVEERGLPFYGI